MNISMTLTTTIRAAIIRLWHKILFGLTGTGYFDMVAYQKYNDGEMSDYIPTDADLQQGFDGLPKVD